MRLRVKPGMQASAKLIADVDRHVGRHTANGEAIIYGHAEYPPPGCKQAPVPCEDRACNGREYPFYYVSRRPITEWIFELTAVDAQGRKFQHSFAQGKKAWRFCQMRGLRIIELRRRRRIVWGRCQCEDCKANDDYERRRRIEQWLGEPGPGFERSETGQQFERMRLYGARIVKESPLKADDDKSIEQQLGRFKDRQQVYHSAVMQGKISQREADEQLKRYIEGEKVRGFVALKKSINLGAAVGG